MLNLASSAGLPADFPLDAADFANYPGTTELLNKIFCKICSAAQALWKILLEICQNCRYFMVCLGKCCGERFKYVCWILKEMVKVPGGFLSNELYCIVMNDGIAPIFIIIVHKFKLKVSICTTR